MEAVHAFIPAAATAGYLLLMLAAYVVRRLVRGPLPPEARLDKRHDSFFAPAWVTNFVMFALRPFERLFLLLRFSPNALTFASLCSAAAAAVAVAFGHFGAGGWLYLFCGALDLFDGRFARRSGRVTTSGAFYDSIVDRWAEGILFGGLAIYYRQGWMLYVVLACLIGSYMVSYTRARGESLGVLGNVGTMQRPERIVALGLGLALSPALAVFLEPAAPWRLYHLTVGALSFVALSSLGTALYRFAHVFASLRRKEEAPAGAEAVAGAPDVAPVAGAPDVAPVAGAPDVAPVAAAPEVAPVAAAPEVAPVAAAPDVAAAPAGGEAPRHRVSAPRPVA